MFKDLQISARPAGGPEASLTSLRAGSAVPLGAGMLADAPAARLPSDDRDLLWMLSVAAAMTVALLLILPELIPAPAPARIDVAAGSALAVSLEPPGGSPKVDVPTGPITAVGKLAKI